MSSVGIGLVGAGPWGLTLAAAFEKVPGASLRWICEIDGGRRARAAAAHPGARVTADLADLLADPEVRAVVVAVDPARHHPVAMRALAADRHVFVEKPLALSAADAEMLHAAAHMRRRILTVGHLLSFHPAVTRARQIVAEDRLGEPLRFESIRQTVGAPRTPGSAWWALAPHDVSLALDLFASVPVTVSATAGAITGSDHDGAASGVLCFAGGRTAHIQVGRFAAEKTRRLTIAGRERTLTFDELAPGHPLHLRERGGQAPTPIPVETLDPLSAQCRHFVASVRGERPSAGNGAHALAVVQVLDAGARSMRTGGAPVAVLPAPGAETEGLLVESAPPPRLSLKP
jgi:predicted dehydrogenase